MSNNNGQKLAGKIAVVTGGSLPLVSIVSLIDRESPRTWTASRITGSCQL